MTVRDAVFGVMRRFGMTRIFGNPGSTEVPFLVDLPDDSEFVLGNAGKNTLNTYIQPALVAGSPDLRADCEVRRVTIEERGDGLEATSVEYLTPDGRLLQVEADVVDVVHKYRYSTGLLTMVSDENNGTMWVDDAGNDRYSFAWNDVERERIAASTKFARDVLEAAGAKRVFQTGVVSTHVQGSCRMGSDPERSVVGAHTESHDVRRLFVGDGSVIPHSSCASRQSRSSRSPSSIRPARCRRPRARCST